MEDYTGLNKQIYEALVRKDSQINNMEEKQKEAGDSPVRDKQQK